MGCLPYFKSQGWCNRWVLILNSTIIRICFACLEFVGLSTTGMKLFQISSQTINTINLLDQYYSWVITWWPIPHPLCTNSKHEMLKSPKFEFIDFCMKNFIIFVKAISSFILDERTEQSSTPTAGPVTRWNIYFGVDFQIVNRKRF